MGILLFNLNHTPMNTQEKEQLFLLLQNLEESRKIIPTFSDLTQHPVF
jgi:hypothetical protein